MRMAAILVLLGILGLLVAVILLIPFLVMANA